MAMSSGYARSELHDLRCLLRRYQNHEIVISSNQQTFRIGDHSDSDTSCEVHISNIPTETSLSRLVRLFEPHGLLLRFSLFVNDDGTSVGKATAVYETEEDAMNAEDKLNGILLQAEPPQTFTSAGCVIEPENTKEKEDDISPPQELVVRTEMGRRLYVANIPKNKTKEEIQMHFSRFLRGLVDVMLYTYPGSTQNRGFCFIEFSSSKTAMAAKEMIVLSRPWGCEVVVDWADPEQEPDNETMKTVKVLYLKNLSSKVTDEGLKRLLEERGLEVERVKVIRDFGFVHFYTRALAEAAFEACKDLIVDGIPIHVSWAKPPINKRMREEVLRRRERRMRRMLASRYSGRGVNVGQGDY